jgi:methyl-accepting chemotaxis protein
MNTSLSIRVRILCIIIGIGFVFGLLLAFYTPYQSRTLANEMLLKDAQFITGVLADNLALGMQTHIVDNGAALKQTLQMMRRGSGQDEMVSRVRVFNDKLQYVDGLNAGSGGVAPRPTDKVTLTDTGNLVRAWAPMRDADQGIVGYVEIEYSKAFFQSRSGQNARLNGLIALIAFIATVLITLLTVGRLTKAIQQLSVAAKEVSAGKIDVAIPVRSRDEVGQLADSLRDMIRLHKDRAFAAKAIAQGDLTAKVEKMSEDDVLGAAMVTMKDKIRAMVEEIRRLASAALEGGLSYRADVSRHGGDFAEIISGVNSTLNAVIGPINEAAQVMDRIASKDLTARVTGRYKGDLASITSALNTAAANLEEALQVVALTAEQVASASTQISVSSQALSRGAGQQASSLEEVSSSLQEMAAMTRQNQANAKQAHSLSQVAQTSADKGMDSMQRLSDAIQRIKGSSDATAKIIKTIDEIAFQTNLLALNAAVEAARAGDAGKGFAVVAEEVRNLAMRSAEAAKNTSRLIEESVNNAESGVSINQEVLANLSEITAQVNRMSAMVSEIAAASDQQSQGVEQVNSAVEQINQVTQQTAASAEESASAAFELSRQAEDMKRLVSSFRLGAGSARPALRPVAVSADLPAAKAKAALPGQTTAEPARFRPAVG